MTKLAGRTGLLLQEKLFCMLLYPYINAASSVNITQKAVALNSKMVLITKCCNMMASKLTD